MYVQDFNSIRAELLNARALFVDPQFPPNSRSLYNDGRPPPETSNAGNIVWKRPTDMVSRPKFVVEGAKQHDLDQGLLGNCWFIAGAAVLATTHPVEFEKVVPSDQSFDPNTYTGMFRFNFWWYGKWTEIVVDDYLPTDGQKPIYCRNIERPNEFWPCLLEKAYAKYLQTSLSIPGPYIFQRIFLSHVLSRFSSFLVRDQVSLVLRGNYESLEGGKMQDAMVDLTGGISEVIDIRKRNEISPDLYSLLYTSFQMKTLMGACIFKPKYSPPNEVELKNGLYMGHAYSITGFRQIPTGRRTENLLCLRNPWGFGEWKGAWSDRSQEMKYLIKELQDQLKYTYRDDGEFWMSYDDFIDNFHEIDLCHMQPDALIEELSDNYLKQQWNVTVYHDAWIKGITAGGRGNAPNENLYWKNPQFFVTLTAVDSTLGHGDDCTLIVSLMEKESNNQSMIAVDFDVYKLKSPELRPLDNSRAPKNALLLTQRSMSNVSYRDVTKRFELKPGTYVIIPSTFNPHEEAKFMLRLFTDKWLDIGVLDEVTYTPSSLIFKLRQSRHEVGIQSLTKPATKDQLQEAFDRHAGNDQKMDASELSKFLADISSLELRDTLKFPIESCHSLVSQMDNDKSGFLDFHEAKRAWKEIKAYREVFKQFDKDNSNSVDTYELGTMFLKLGFPICRSVLTSIVRRYEGRDNTITLPDFVMIICKLTSLLSSFHEQQKRNKVSGDHVDFSRNEFLEVTMFI